MAEVANKTIYSLTQDVPRAILHDILVQETEEQDDKEDSRKEVGGRRRGGGRRHAPGPLPRGSPRERSGERRGGRGERAAAGTALLGHGLPPPRQGAAPAPRGRDWRQELACAKHEGTLDGAATSDNRERPTQIAAVYKRL